MDFGSAGSRHGTPSSGRGRRTQNIRDTRNLTKRTLMGEDTLDERYPSALNLYPVPPTQDISLELFEDLAVQRLRVGVRHNIIGSNKI